MSEMIECKDEKSWLEAREWHKPGDLVVTASQANKLVNNPLAFYAERKGLLPPVVQNERMLWGKRLQRAIGQGFGEDTGRVVEEAPPFTIFRCPDAPFIGASLDFFEKDKEKGEGILEAKNVSAEWIEAVPIAYQIQVQVQLLCLPARKFGTVAGLKGGNTLQWQDVERHDAFLKRFISLAEEMQWRLIHNKPPEVANDGSEQTREALSALYPVDSGSKTALPAEAVDWTKELLQLKESQKTLEEQVRLRENRLKQAIGESTYGVLANGAMWSWKKQTRVDPPRPTERVTEFRVLRYLRNDL